MFSVMSRQLLEKLRAEKDKMLPDEATIIFTHFPRYDVIVGSLYSWIETLIWQHKLFYSFKTTLW